MLKRMFAAALLLFAFGCATNSTTIDRAGLDHIMVGVPDLDRAIADFQKATGVTPQRGGQHPGRGTQNALVSLGHFRYLELIAPVPDATSSDDFVTYLRGLHEPAVVGWAVHVADIADARSRLKSSEVQPSEPQKGSRIMPDGRTLSWTTFGISHPSEDAMPFFIHWDRADAHPSLTAPACALDSFEVLDPRGGEIATILQRIGITGIVQTATQTRMTLTLRCGDRAVTFASR